MAEWISVEDRLPPDMHEVLLYAPRTQSINIGWWDPRRGEWESKDRDSFSKKGWYTHWMPLPEPPKQETPKAITIDIHINDEQVDVDDFASYVAEAMKKAIRRF